MKYLWFWVPREGVKTNDKIIEAIKNMTPPTTENIFVILLFQSINISLFGKDAQIGQSY